ncbi:hypothetical protein SAMN05192569_102833 [Parageobacillus thermantarcticus]|uniref:Uncharacterized protein n=1 Tax=Parageobacillus thermantarcticus TaxID=186116 RepID=A0A1I0TGS9_9BACL|nr:hypothetical protein [Parageobacillus thermantarcticus]SFA50991.1 hypothetical protein SAMN05192569_102833 [Parageobacillus thermantarcticus]
MNLLGRKCLAVIDGVLSAGTVIEEYRYNVVMLIPEYKETKIVRKDNLVTKFNPSAVKRLEKVLK